MRLATYKGMRQDVFNIGETIEIHMETKLPSGIKYLVRKHKLLGDYPFANLHAVRNPIIFTDEDMNYYAVAKRNFVWVPPNDFDFLTKNTGMKHVLTKLEE